MKNLIKLCFFVLIIKPCYSQNEFIGIWILDSLQVSGTFRQDIYEFAEITIDSSFNYTIRTKTRLDTEDTLIALDDNCINVSTGKAKIKKNKLIISNYKFVNLCDKNVWSYAPKRLKFFVKKEKEILSIRGGKTVRYYHLKSKEP